MVSWGQKKSDYPGSYHWIIHLDFNLAPVTKQNRSTFFKAQKLLQDCPIYSSELGTYNFYTIKILFLHVPTSESEGGQVYFSWHGQEIGYVYSEIGLAWK